MYERILIPLDGSKVGETALHNVEDLVTKLVPNTKVEIILLQVISDLTFDVLTDSVAAQLPYSENDMDIIKRSIQEYLDKIAQSLKEKGIITSTLIVEGNTAEEILKAAQNSKADLIAMSSHGRSGFRRWALGSITDKVLHESKIPVLTVRAMPPEKS